MSDRDDLIERLCARQHDAYEDAAVIEGWTTQAASRKPWADVPEANKATRRRSLAAVLDLMESEGRLQEPTGTPPPTEASGWRWATRAEGSVNLLRRADEAAARRAAGTSGSPLRIYRRHHGLTAWEEVTES